MRGIKHRQGVVVAAAALWFFGCGTTEPANEGQQREALSNSASKADTSPGAQADGRALTDERGYILTTLTPAGLTPDELRSAYKLPGSGGGGRKIAIVDPYDNPNAEADLAVYRAQFGLPPCTTANGCFQKVNQDGKSSPLPAPAPAPTPMAPTDWALEIAMSLDMASAGCPDCKILLVEANSNYLNDLGAAEITAVRLGAAVVSNDWTAREDIFYPGAAADATYFNHPGVSIFVSSGDQGEEAPPQYPSSSQYVTAVGGTKLSKSIFGSRGWNEMAWGGLLKSLGSGSGCSQQIPKPSWQKDLLCSKRMVADVAAVADNIAVYDTYGAYSGWITVYGTSASAPLVAAIYALTGNAGADPSFPYNHRGAFFDVISGSTGLCLLRPYYCAASFGYDGPTGIGTPNGSAL